MTELKPLLVSLDEVTRLTGKRRSSIYADVKSGKFPAPVKVGSASRWVYDEIEAWVMARIRERDGDAQRETEELIEAARTTGRSVDELYAARSGGVTP